MILLYGHCKMKNVKVDIGPKMGIGYVFNEEALFTEENELRRMTQTESLVTCEESAFLCVKTSIFNDMVDMDSNRNRGSSPHMMEDQDLLWEFFERHHFVKSTLRLNERLIQEMPELRTE